MCHQECCKLFGNVNMRVASNAHAEKYLHDVYGPNWRTNAETPFMDHVTNEAIPVGIFNITSSPRLLGPAIPFQ